MKKYLLALALVTLATAAYAGQGYLKRLLIPVSDPLVKWGMSCTAELSYNLPIYRCENDETVCYTSANGGVVCRFKEKDEPTYVY